MQLLTQISQGNNYAGNFLYVKHLNDFLFKQPIKFFGELINESRGD